MNRLKTGRVSHREAAPVSSLFFRHGGQIRVVKFYFWDLQMMACYGILNKLVKNHACGF